MTTELATAIHECGHAVAITMAFRKARWLPKPPPRNPIHFVQIGANGTGNCQASNVYTPGRSPIDDDHFPLMTAQVIIEISGGISEALHHCGTRPNGSELWAFAEDRCGVGTDLMRAQAVLDDLRRLTGFRYYAHEFAEAAAAMLNWRGVSELAKPGRPPPRRGRARPADHRPQPDQARVMSIQIGLALPLCFPEPIPGKRVCKKPLRHRIILERQQRRSLSAA